MNKKIISTDLSPEAIGPYSQAIRAGDFIFVSGQIPLDPHTGKLIEDLSLEAQTRQVLFNLQGVLTGAGIGLSEVVKVTIYLSDMDNFHEVNGIYAEFFEHCPPARVTVEVAALPLDAAIEIDCIAFLG